MAPVILVHLAATFYMTGVIWFVQVVHYPLVALVGLDGASRYAQSHARRTGPVVIAAMLVEAATAVLLVVRAPAGTSPALALVGAGLLVLIWLSTFALQVPAHRRLASGFDARVHRRLVATNWIRTAAWTARAGIATLLAASPPPT
jgi:hypothetical protein